MGVLCGFYMYDVVVKRSRSLCHLPMTSFLLHTVTLQFNITSSLIHVWFYSRHAIMFWQFSYIPVSRMICSCIFQLYSFGQYELLLHFPVLVVQAVRSAPAFANYINLGLYDLLPHFLVILIWAVRSTPAFSSSSRVRRTICSCIFQLC